MRTYCTGKNICTNLGHIHSHAQGGGRGTKGEEHTVRSHRPCKLDSNGMRMPVQTFAFCHPKKNTEVSGAFLHRIRRTT